MKSIDARDIALYAASFFIVVYYAIVDLHNPSIFGAIVTAGGSVFGFFIVYAFSYVLSPVWIFWLVAFAQCAGVISSMTGSELSVYSSLFGVSFYVAGISFLRVMRNDCLSIHMFNPILYITGPVLIYIRNKKINIANFTYTVRVFVFCLFLLLVISPNLYTALMKVPSISVFHGLISAFLFEFFIYINFLALSMLMHAFFRIFGYDIPRNFKQPFSSLNIVEYWRGWHTSLSAVLKKVFFQKKIFYGINFGILAVFLSSAFWHGVTVNFLAWGVWHSFIFMLSSYFKRFKLFVFLVYLIGVVFGRYLFMNEDLTGLFYKPLIADGVFRFNAFEFFAVGSVVLMFFYELNERIQGRLSRNYAYLKGDRVQILMLLMLLFMPSANGVLYAVYGQR